MKKSDDCCICRELVEQVLELDIDGNQKRNDCWRVKRCYVFFEEGSSYESDGEEASEDSNPESTPTQQNPYIVEAPEIFVFQGRQQVISRDEENAEI